MSDRESLPLYERGQWTDAPSPLTGRYDDLAKALEAVGYSPESTRFGTVDRGFGGDPGLEVFIRTKVPSSGVRSGGAQYLIVVSIGGASRMVLAGDVVDVMDLLQRWVPTVQSWTVIDILRQIDGLGGMSFTRDDLVSLVAARVIHGVRHGDEWHRP